MYCHFQQGSISNRPQFSNQQLPSPNMGPQFPLPFSPELSLFLIDLPQSLIKNRLCWLNFPEHLKPHIQTWKCVFFHFSHLSYYGENCILTKSHFAVLHDDVIKWKHFPHYWPFVRGSHRSPVNSPHKGQWCGPLMFPLIYAWINGCGNNREAGDLRPHCAHYDITVMAT